MRSRKIMITKDRTVFQWDKFKAQMKIVMEARNNGKWAILDDEDEAVVKEFKNKKPENPALKLEFTPVGATVGAMSATQQLNTSSPSPLGSMSREKNE